MAITWKIDLAHSEIQFRVRYLTISAVTGYFRRFEGEFVTETEDFRTCFAIRVTIEVDSVDTRDEQRDIHLRSEDFFDVGKYSQILFVGNTFDPSQTRANLRGHLTIRGISRPVVLDAVYGGAVRDVQGRLKAGFTVSATISRKTFGLAWDAVTEAGSVMVGDEITIQAALQVIRQ